MRLLFVVVGAMLIAAPGTGNGAQHRDRLDALRQIATGIGSVSGAASVCREKSWPRMKALTDKFSELLKTSVTNGDEFSSIQQAYDQSTIDGQLTVISRQVDCGAAVRDLADLERAVASQPPVAVTTGASPSAAPVTTGAAPLPTLTTTTGAVAGSVRGLVAHKADARAAQRRTRPAYTASPFGNTFAPLSYGGGGTGRWF